MRPRQARTSHGKRGQDDISSLEQVLRITDHLPHKPRPLSPSLPSFIFSLYDQILLFPTQAHWGDRVFAEHRIRCPNRFGLALF